MHTTQQTNIDWKKDIELNTVVWLLVSKEQHHFKWMSLGRFVLLPETTTFNVEMFYKCNGKKVLDDIQKIR